jgi:DNA-binding CsgD family transcriptional regulator
MLLDRHEERLAIDRLIRGVREGRSGALVLRGEAGIGKTALLDYAFDQAADMSTARVAGVESEMTLGFAGLHQLLVPFLAGIDELPEPQREALKSTFGVVPGDPPNPFLIGLAVLTLLSATAERRPLICVIDDTQWLDDESIRVLSFVARRLHADHVGFVFALTDPSRVQLEGLSQLVVGELPTADACQLLASVAPGRGDPAIMTNIVLQTRGNPLALVELANEITADQLAGIAPLPEPVPVGRTLQQRFLRRFQSLPAESRTLLLMAAAEPSGDELLIQRAAGALGITWETALSPEAELLMTFDPRATFRHPLVRSAIYHGSSMVERRRVHQALADSTDAASFPDRRAWHLAAATVGPDEVVAAELERYAEAAQQRGGYAAAAALLERAASLTPDPGRQALRMLFAAQAELVAGAPARAQTLLEAASAHLTADLDQARARAVQGTIWFMLGRFGETSATLLSAAETIERFDHPTAVDEFLFAETAALYAGELAQGSRDIDVARAALSALGSRTDFTTTAELLLYGVSVRLTTGRSAAIPFLQSAVAAASRDTEPTWPFLGCLTAGEVFDDRAWASLAARWVEQDRGRGALTTLPVALNYLSWSEVLNGRFGVAAACMSEAHEISGLTGFRGLLGEPSPADLLLMAWQGDAEKTRAAAQTMVRDGIERGQGAAIGHAQAALAILELSCGRYEVAKRCALDVFEYDYFYLGTAVLPDLIEASVRCGDVKCAENALARLSDQAVACDTDLAIGLLARSRALLGPDPDTDAELLYREAISRLERCLMVTELARTHLLFGEWLRRQGRRRDAQEQLRIALERFERMGAEGFAERTRIELRASGERIGSKLSGAQIALTPQEAQIVEHVANGAKNAEVAAQLFISPSTVDYHLRKVFRKLGVNSRTQLVRLYSEQPDLINT